MADVLVASNWTNGIRTMEITRKLVTPYGADDVQFDDLTRDYAFSLTISNGDLVGETDYFWETGVHLRFQQ